MVNDGGNNNPDYGKMASTFFGAQSHYQSALVPNGAPPYGPNQTPDSTIMVSNQPTLSDLQTQPLSVNQPVVQWNWKLHHKSRDQGDFPYLLYDDLEAQLRQNVSAMQLPYPTCARASKYSDSPNRDEHGIEVCFVAKGTEERLEAAYYVHDGKKIMVVQGKGRSNWNHGRPAVVVASNFRDGARRKWFIWKPSWQRIENNDPKAAHVERIAVELLETSSVNSEYGVENDRSLSVTTSEKRTTPEEELVDEDDMPLSKMPRLIQPVDGASNQPSGRFYNRSSEPSELVVTQEQQQPLTMQRIESGDKCTTSIRSTGSAPAVPQQRGLFATGLFRSPSTPSTNPNRIMLVFSNPRRPRSRRETVMNKCNTIRKLFGEACAAGLAQQQTHALQLVVEGSHSLFAITRNDRQTYIDNLFQDIREEVRIRNAYNKVNVLPLDGEYDDDDDEGGKQS